MGWSGGAPTNAQYVALATNGILESERVLTAGAGIALADAGANGNVTVSLSGAGAGAAFVQGGNSFAAGATIGTNDANSFTIETGNTARAVFENSYDITLKQATASYTLRRSDPAAARILTIPDPLADDTFAFLSASQTLASKTLTAPDINAGTADSLTSLSIRDTSAAFDVTIGATSSTILDAGRALTIDMVNAARTVKLTGNPTLADWFDQSVKTTANPTFGNLTPYATVELVFTQRVLAFLSSPGSAR